MSSLLWALLSWQVIVSCSHPQYNPGSPGVALAQRDTDDPGVPLFLTPLIERGEIAEAKRLARVTLDNSLQIESYTGFFTVNKAYDSNQFFWYFPSMTPDKDKAPVLIWLQGGPGGSSLFGSFLENGPITVNNGKFERREYHWALNHHVIYIDNPVGAGFSFTKHEKGYCTDEVQVGEQLYSTLTQFFKLFPELQQNDFYITGESYAGKYVPALAHTILKKDSTAKAKVNLKGLVIGGAWINPDSQKNFWSGKTCQPYCSDDDWHNAAFVEILNKNTIRKAIHVGDVSYYELSCEVYHHLMVDFCESMAPWLSELLDHYPVTLYGGRNDDIVPYLGIVDFLRNHFNFTGANEYRNATQYSWWVDGEVAGCVRRARRLTEIYVLDATHYVPKDQPKRAWDLITRITHGKGFDQNEICPYPPPAQTVYKKTTLLFQTKSASQ